MYVKALYILSFLFFLMIIPPGGFSAWSYQSGFRWLYLFMLSFLFYHIIHPLTIRFAYKVKALDVPNERKIHNSVIPKAGGIGIFLAFVFTVLRNFQFSTEIWSLLISSFIVFLLGLFDDVKELSPITRLFFQVFAAFIVVFGGISVKFPTSWDLFGKLLSVIISVLWIVGITNTFNFIDGIDGLAGSLTLIICFVFLMIVVGTSQFHVMFITASVCGAVSAFLFYNFNPAKIFLGDSGSTLIGFILGVLSIYVSWTDNNPLIAFSSPFIVLFIPIFDLLYTTVSRVKNGLIRSIYDWLSYAGKDHIHHRLLSLGFSVNEVVLIISLINLLCGMIAVNLVLTSIHVKVLVSYIQMASLFGIVLLFMRKGRQIV